jgi:septum formation protein
LARLGLPFEALEAEGVDEGAARGNALEICSRLAREKAEKVLQVLTARARPDRGWKWIVLGADTLVAAGEGAREEALGKPRDLEHARQMLRSLSGRAHRVLTGIAVAPEGHPTRVAVETSQVIFHPLSGEDIERYLETGEHEGKAGAYAIQGKGGDLVAGFSGCYYNIVGLPLVLTARLLGIEPDLACDCGRHRLQRGQAGCRHENLVQE